MSEKQKEIWESLQKMRAEIENHTDLGWMLEAIDKIINYLGNLEIEKEVQKAEVTGIKEANRLLIEEINKKSELKSK